MNQITLNPLEDYLPICRLLERADNQFELARYLKQIEHTYLAPDAEQHSYYCLFLLAEAGVL